MPRPTATTPSRRKASTTPASAVDPLGFRVGAANTRRVEPRNTPSMINAVFNHRQFWDGRAENVFNGVNHLGTRDPAARVFRADDPGAPVEVRVALVNSSLASQAVAPIVSDLEMAAPGRTAQDVGRELAEGQRKQGKRRATRSGRWRTSRSHRRTACSGR